MEPETEKDPFIGQRFGEQGQVEVISSTNKRNKGNNRYYLVACSVCGKDEELFGNGEFVTTKASLKQGCLPCGCAKQHRWTTEQYRIRLLRECTRQNLTMSRLDLEEITSHTRIHITCNLDGNKWSTKVFSLLSKGQGCSKCYHKKRVVEEGNVVTQFAATGKFLEGTQFIRRPERGYKKRCWDVVCPKCSEDEYVRAGVCNGVFESSTRILKEGFRPCRCSHIYTWTQEQQTYRVKKVAAQGGEEFVCWVRDYENVYSEMVVECSVHGLYITTANAYLNQESKCPCCVVHGFNPLQHSALYVLKAVGQYTSFTGYGISNQLDTRIKTHKRNLLKYDFVIDEMEVFYMGGYAAQSLENKIKFKFERFPQDICGFRTEATFDYMYMDVINFIERGLENMSLEDTRTAEQKAKDELSHNLQKPYNRDDR